MKNTLILYKDGPAAIVVFIVALTFSMGIALGSGAPLFAGLITGVIGGIVVGSISQSQVSVSGPSAGLGAIFAAGVISLGDYRLMLMAVCLAGVIQILLGNLRVGIIGHFFPSAVVKGIITAIGVILVLKQIPHALGLDKVPEGDEGFFQPDGENTISELLNVFSSYSLPCIVIASITFLTFFLWDKYHRNSNALANIPGALAAVCIGTAVSLIFRFFIPSFSLGPEHLVNLPVLNASNTLWDQIIFPDPAGLLRTQVYAFAIIIALVASLESLISIEASDKLDPVRRVTPLNRELIAQGIGNFISGCVGGLPVTSIIVHSTVNVTAGAKTKWATIIHGCLLLGCILLIPKLLNFIPLSSLAAVLIMVGYKLINPLLFRAIYEKGWSQFIPFIATVISILLTNLLTGIIIGLVVGFIVILVTNYHTAILYTKDGNKHLIRFVKDVTFVNKAALRKYLDNIPNGDFVMIDTSRYVFVDHDIEETLEEFVMAGPERHLRIEMRGKGQPVSENQTISW